MDTNNLNRFKEVYTEVLSRSVKLYPSQYEFTCDEVPFVVENRMPGIINGSVMVGDALKEVCRILNIEAKSLSISEYLKK